MKLKLVIQETTAGLNNQFVSEGLDINDEFIKSSLKDERMLATQLAQRSIVYSIQNLEKHKVYSAIFTDITDISGSKGYYTIKIYTQRDSIIRNLISLFEEIKSAYLQYKANNQINSQNYDAILSKASIQGQVKIVCPKAEKTCFLQYNDQQDIENALNNLKVYSIDKLYLFDAEKALKTETILGQGLINFNTLADNLDAFEVDNSTMILRSLFIGEKQFSASNFPETFRAFRKRNDSIAFLTSDNSEKQNGVLQSGILKINKKVVNAYTQPTKTTIGGGTGSRKRKKTFYEQFQIPIISILLLIVGGVGYYVFLYNQHNPKSISEKSSGGVNLTNNSNDEGSGESKKGFNFQTNDTLSDNYLVLTLDYNIETKSRYFIRQKTGKDQVSCQVIKKNNLKPGKYPSNLLKKDITDVFKIKADSVELFIQKLEDKCGCTMNNNGQIITETGKGNTNGSGGKKSGGNYIGSSGNSISGDDEPNIDQH
ncbi:MAG: hypothetical protein RL264_1804 [Bacteroidota bacterium]|jgi:hypothetical protein